MDCRLKLNRNKHKCILIRKINRYPLQSTKRQLDSSTLKWERFIAQNTSPQELATLNRIQEKFRTGKNSLAYFTNKDGSLNKWRRKFHKEILRNKFKNQQKDTKDPDLYIFGGLPASAKTSALRKYVPEGILMIDSDNFKESLSKKTKSPIKRFELAHAQLLHDESDLLVEEAINKCIQNRNNVGIDMTFGTYEKGKDIISKFRKAGYDIHFLGTQKYPHKTVKHVAERLIKAGRFVPLSYVKIKGNKISKNSWRARRLADTYLIVDTNKLPPKLIAKSRLKITDNIRNPK